MWKKLLFLPLTSSNSKVCPSFCEIMISWTLVIAYIWKTLKQIKSKPKFIWKLRTNFCWECYDLAMRQNSERNYQCFVKLELLKVLFGTENYMNIRSAHFVNIRFMLNNPRFNNWFKGQRDIRVSNFCQIS